jgi:hypothetical protein
LVLIAGITDEFTLVPETQNDSSVDPGRRRRKFLYAAPGRYLDCPLTMASDHVIL